MNSEVNLTKRIKTSDRTRGTAKKRIMMEGSKGPGFDAFRHFNVGMMDALRVPLKTIQERIGHVSTIGEADPLT